MRWKKRTAVLATAAAVLAGAGCAGQDEEQQTAAAAVELVDVDAPQLGRLAPEVREQLVAAQERLAALGDDADDATRAAAYGDLARQYHAYSLFEPAVAAYTNAQTLQPVDFRWPYYLGHIHRSLGQAEESREAFDRAAELRPDNAPILAAAARSLRDGGELDRAEELASRALELDSSSGGALLVLAEIAADRLEHELAIERYEALLAAQPGATKLYSPLAMEYREIGNIEKAEALVALRGGGAVALDDPLMLELQGFRGGARVDLEEGHEAFQRGDYAAAVTAFRSAVDTDADDLEARLNLGSALLKSGQADEAIAQYEEVLRRTPNNPSAHFDLGVAMAQQGDDARAIDSYRKALEADPLYRGPRFNLANSLRRSGRCEEALEHYRYLIEANPGDGSARLGEAVCLIEEELYADARQRFKEALQALPTSRSLANAAARYLATCPDDSVRDGGQALRLAEQLLQLDQRPEYTETLAMALAENGRFDEAIAHQSKLLEAAEGAKRDDVAPRLRANLDRYRRGEAAREAAIG